MSYAVAGAPARFRRLLLPAPYATAGAELADVLDAMSKARGHYYAPVTRRSEAVETVFRQLADQWQADTLFESSISRMTEHPAYQAIIGLGEVVVPLLLRELDITPHHWFVALEEITGVNPVGSHERGDVGAMSRAWLRWGRAHGYRW